MRPANTVAPPLVGWPATLTRSLTDTGTPASYVTHDHDEARAIADRIALMRDGRIVQVGSWGDLTSDPADEWVGRFLGV